MSAVEDSYRPDAKLHGETVFTFDESGAFKRQDKSRLEEGAYLIGTNDEFVIYIEKVNGEQLQAARVERYTLSDQSENAFTLDISSRKLRLRKR